MRPLTDPPAFRGAGPKAVQVELLGAEKAGAAAGSGPSLSVWDSGRSGGGFMGWRRLGVVCAKAAPAKDKMVKARATYRSLWICKGSPGSGVETYRRAGSTIAHSGLLAHLIP